ncbi:MAG: glycosyltransferase family 2 protein [Bacilli bacterium]|nr:glycosyltransferase family 2 protein [Bacilli bacterium]
MSKVGMVVLNYNDYKTTDKYINSIKDFKALSEIIIVDNNSTDGSYEKLKKYENNKIKVIKTEKNRGYSYGNNVGIKALSNVDYVIISNPDILVEEKVITKLKKDLEKTEDAAIVAPVIKQLGEYKRGWRLPTIEDEILLNINYYRRRVVRNLEYNEARFKTPLTRVDVVPGCFFMIKKGILDLIGNFDEATFLYYEENILATKLKNINKKSYIDSEVVVTHDLSVSVNKTFNSIKKYKLLKESQKYYVKYYLKARFFDMILLGFTYRLSLVIAYIVNFIKKLRSKKK